MYIGWLDSKTEWITLIVTSLIALFAYYFHFRTRSYFTDRNIKFIRGWPFIGVFHKMIRGQLAITDAFDELYKVYPDEPIIGIFDMGGKPNYIIRDPDLIKRITIKDFDYFVDHQFVIDEDMDPLIGRSLFFMRGQKWKDMRTTLSPAFTGSKMRLMFTLLTDSTDRFVEQLKSNKSFVTDVCNLKELFRQYAAITISTCAFGMEIESFPDGGKEFRDYGQSLVNFDGQQAKFMAYASIPKLMKLFRIKLLKEKDTHYFRELIMTMIRHRQQHSIVRNDMINLLLELKKGIIKSPVDESNKLDAGFSTAPEYSNKNRIVTDHEWTDDDMVAQVIVFFVAGFDTVSTNLSFLLHELAMNPEIQQRLYEEIISVKNEIESKVLTYEQITHLKYLDCVISETMRRWSSIPASDRSISKPYELDIGDGRKVLLEPGAGIFIPNTSLQMDPKYFPNPERFDPERFNEDNRNKIHPAVYMPFGIGPRNCIGSRFALMEMKCIVYYLLQEFRVEPCPLTQNPLRYRANTGTIDVEGGFWVQFKSRHVKL